jgi:hypothetical protein
MEIFTSHNQIITSEDQFCVFNMDSYIDTDQTQICSVTHTEELFEFELSSYFILY